jgi:CBS domain containing-hemolysin-like protein
MTSAESLGLEAAIGLLVVASIAAVQARAVRGAKRHGLLELCRLRGRPERYDEILAASETIAFVAASVVVIAAAASTLIASRLVWPTGERPWSIGASAVAGWIACVWLLLVAVPMLVTKVAGPWFVVATWGLWKPVVSLIRPLVQSLGAGGTLLGRMLGRTVPVTRESVQEELRLVVDEAHREGRLEEAARDMIEGVMELNESRVSQIMTTRTEMISIPLASTWDEAVRLASASHHTRLPVWDRSPDDIVGILHTRELLTALVESMASPGVGSRQSHDLRGVLRPPYFVPESMSVQKLLREFQRTHTHIAVVTDEFGGVSGLVTIEDALEEIVGEIADEHDEAFSDGIRIVSHDVCEAQAQVRIADINEAMGLQLPEEADFETIGGFTFHQFGRIPQAGERVESHGVVVEVLSASGRRIDVVRIERLRG